MSRDWSWMSTWKRAHWFQTRQYNLYAWCWTHKAWQPPCHHGHYDFCCTNLLGKLTTFQAAIRSSGHASSGSQDSTIGPASAVASADVFSMTWAQSSWTQEYTHTHQPRVRLHIFGERGHFWHLGFCWAHCPCADRWLNQMPLSQVGVKYGSTEQSIAHGIDNRWKNTNLLELRAVYLALSHFLDMLQGLYVFIHSDNMMTMYNINHQGGTWSLISLCLIYHLLKWAFPRLASLKSVQLPGCSTQ